MSGSCKLGQRVRKKILLHWVEINSALLPCWVEINSDGTSVICFQIAINNFLSFYSHLLFFLSSVKLCSVYSQNQMKYNILVQYSNLRSSRSHEPVDSFASQKKKSVTIDIIKFPLLCQIPSLGRIIQKGKARLKRGKAQILAPQLSEHALLRWRTSSCYSCGKIYLQLKVPIIIKRVCHIPGVSNLPLNVFCNWKESCCGDSCHLP